jgi:hypothetical protein
MNAWKELELLLAHLRPRPDPNADQHAFELPTLALHHARWLEGKRVRFLVAKKSRCQHFRECTAFVADAPDGFHATVLLRGRVDEAELPERFIVKAKLAVIEHQALTLPDGTCFPAFTEYRLHNADR